MQMIKKVAYLLFRATVIDGTVLLAKLVEHLVQVIQVHLKDLTVNVSTESLTVVLMEAQGTQMKKVRALEERLSTLEEGYTFEEVEEVEDGETVYDIGSFSKLRMAVGTGLLQ